MYKILFFSNYSLRSLLTPKMLIYVYIFLRNRVNNFPSNLGFFRPISYRWLYRVSYLIRNGNFDYCVCATCF